MPVKISSGNILEGSPTSRLDAFRKTIKDGEGFTLKELAAMPCIATSVTRIREILCQQGWSIKQWNGDIRNSEHLLVNPKTLAQYAKKNNN